MYINNDGKVMGLMPELIYVCHCNNIFVTDKIQCHGLTKYKKVF